jgi:ElaB/YqjD/DUF883 family membrane-anchored ribosome-binding protein
MNRSEARKVDELSVERAEQDVRRSSDEFETAMEHLEEKVEGTTRKVQRTVELARNPKQIMRNAMSEARSRVSPYFDRGRQKSRQMMFDARESVRENPKPYLFGSLATLVTLFFGGYFLRKRRRGSVDVVIQESIKDSKDMDYTDHKKRMRPPLKGRRTHGAQSH